jgi:hypothetical protein
MTEFVLRGTFAENPPWGFSLREQPVGSRTFIGNGGGAPGVNAEFRFEPAGSYTVVVLSNASPPAATNLLTSILDRLAGLPAPAPQAAPAGMIRTPVPPSSSALRSEIEALHQGMMSAFRGTPRALRSTTLTMRESSTAVCRSSAPGTSSTNPM